MPLTKSTCLFCLLFISLSTHGQDEHNFKMAPEKTDCHQIELTNDLNYNISLIKQSSFRVIKTMKISRYHIPNHVAYYSCDGVVGYLIAQENDHSFLYKEVRKTLYDSLISNDDPIQFYANYIKTKLISQHE